MVSLNFGIWITKTLNWQETSKLTFRLSEIVLGFQKEMEEGKSDLRFLFGGENGDRHMKKYEVFEIP